MFYGLIRIMNTASSENEGHGLTLAASDSQRYDKSETLSEISLRDHIPPVNQDSLQDFNNRMQRIEPTSLKMSDSY